MGEKNEEEGCSRWVMWWQEEERQRRAAAYGEVSRIRTTPLASAMLDCLIFLPQSAHPLEAKKTPPEKGKYAYRQ